MAASAEEISYELGGGLGIAFMGSLMSVVYSRSLVVPEQAADAVSLQDGIDSALAAAAQMPAPLGQEIAVNARLAFDQAVFSVMMATVGVLVVIALLVFVNFRRYSTVSAEQQGSS